MGIFPSPASSARWHRRRFLSLLCIALLLPSCALVVREVKEEYIRVGSAISSWNEELQGEAVPVHGLTDPDHVFEIHPVTLVGDRSLRESFHPVAGYLPEEADDVFESFEKIDCRIVLKGGTTKIVTRKGLYNDVEFLLGIGEDPQQVVEDGRFVNAAVFDLKGKLLAHKVRMVFVKDTPPDRIVKHLRPGNRLHVFGLPRIDLAQIAWRASHSRDHPESLSLPLPYEIIIAGVYEDPGHKPTSQDCYENAEL